MSIQLVTYLLRLLCDKYADTLEQEKEIYRMRRFLDKAFSQCNNGIQDDVLAIIINGIDSAFFDDLSHYDEAKNLKAFIFYGAKKFFQYS